MSTLQNPAQPIMAVRLDGGCTIESEFTIVAIVRDRHAGERTFTAAELQSSLVDCLSDLHLEVVGIKVLLPSYEGREVQGTKLQSTNGAAHAPTK